MGSESVETVRKKIEEPVAASPTEALSEEKLGEHPLKNPLAKNFPQRAPGQPTRP